MHRATQKNVEQDITLKITEMYRAEVDDGVEQTLVMPSAGTDKIMELPVMTSQSRNRLS